MFLADHLLPNMKGRFGLIHWLSGLFAGLLAVLAASIPATDGSEVPVIIIVITGWGVAILALAIRTGRREREELLRDLDRT
jgi:hypothetical protein